MQADFTNTEPDENFKSKIQRKISNLIIATTSKVYIFSQPQRKFLKTVKQHRFKLSPYVLFLYKSRNAWVCQFVQRFSIPVGFVFRPIVGNKR